jgi:SNF2 family DNA or RNA helicase
VKYNHGISYTASTGWLSGISHSYRQKICVAPKTKKLWDAIQLWPKDSVLWQSENVRKSFEAVIEREKFLDSKAAFQAAWRAGREVNLSGITDTKLPLKPYQRVGALLGRAISQDDGFAWFMEQRTGKTPTAICTICDLVMNRVIRQKDGTTRPIRNILIVVPPILKLNWKEEFPRFAPIEGHADILTGTKAERIVKLFKIRSEAKDKKFCAVIVPYDTFVSSYDLISGVSWDIILCDESHWFKDPKTSRAKYLLKMRDKVPFRFILTGTPMGNLPVDFYNQLEFLQEGATESISLKDFKDKTSEISKLPSGIDYVTGIKDCEFLKPILARRSFIVKRVDVMKQLPPKVYEYNSVEMCPEQARHYKELAEFLCTQIEKDIAESENNQSTINHILTQLLRLAQITSGFLVADGDFTINADGEQSFSKKLHFYKENQRLDRLVEIAKERGPNEKMIIWNHWIPMIDVIFERFCKEGLGEQMIVYRGNGSYEHEQYRKWKGPSRDDAKNAFNNDRSKRFLLASAQSANIGLTLPGHPIGNPGFGTLCDLAVYFSYNWSYLQRAQSEDRPYETNSTHQLTVIDLLVEGTIDQEILSAVRNKKDVAENLTNIKEVLKNMFLLKLGAA